MIELESLVVFSQFGDRYHLGHVQPLSGLTGHLRADSADSQDARSYRRLPMMFARTFAASVAGVILIASGCTSVSPVVRGQSPAPEASQIQQVNFQVKGIESHPVYDATLGRHDNMAVTYHDNSVPFPADSSCPNGTGCPTCPGACPSYGSYGYGGYGCPSGNCNHFQHLHPKCVRDSRTYSYKQPSDLRYPMQNQLGGVVVYPYYTHKGPSDFFRK